MIYNITHRTTYRYRSPVSVGEHVACLKPRSFTHNHLLHNEFHIHPAPKAAPSKARWSPRCYAGAADAVRSVRRIVFLNEGHCRC